MSAHNYRLGYRGDIEGLRAVAILLVLGAHAGVPWLAGGFVGVDIFFVLSGFLITGLLLQEMASTGTVKFTDFYLRRLRRLMPALILMIGVTSLVASIVLAPGEQPEQASSGAMAALWLSNIHFAFAKLDYFAAGADSNLFLHTWSLGVEEQFYLLWPALLVWVAGRKLEGRVVRLKAVMLGVAGLSFAACLALTPHAPQFAFYMMPLRAWQFALGALVWLYLREPVADEVSVSTGSLIPASNWVGWLGLCLVVGSGIAFNASMSYPGWRALLPTLGAAAVIAAGIQGAQHGVARCLAWQPLQAIGRVSYSWYLWHWPALLLGYAIVGSHSAVVRLSAVLISLVLAVMSYRLVESPVRHQQYWVTHRKVAWLGALPVMVLASFFSLHWMTTSMVKAQSPELQRFARARVDAPVIYAKGCDDWYNSDRVLVCTYGSEDASHTAVLMGDSIGAQWFPALLRVFDRPDWRLLVLTKSSCPMVDEPFFYIRIGREYTECATWRRHSLEQIVSMRPDIVVLGSVSTYDFTPAQWTEGTARVLSSISGSARHIYLLRGTPHLPFNGPDCLSAHEGRPKWLVPAQVCEAPLSDEHGEQVFQWLQQAGNRFANVQSLDMNDLVCPQGRCSAEQRGMVVFRDSQHITASFAQSLAPAMAQRMGLGETIASQAHNATAAH